jgi:heme-degrading monooxygenase HmoA
MHAVIFEVLPTDSGFQRYLDLAAALRPQLEAIDGFVSIERFRNVRRAGWLLSLSLWRDEAALVHWRSHGEHHAAQAEGRQSVFRDYRIRVAEMRDLENQSEPLAQGTSMGSLVGLCAAGNAAAPPTATLYESLGTPDKRLLLCDFAGVQEALAWQRQASADAMCGSVVRDYGMFERGQAPQHFPAATRDGDDK